MMSTLWSRKRESPPTWSCFNWPGRSRTYPISLSLLEHSKWLAKHWGTQLHCLRVSGSKETSLVNWMIYEVAWNFSLWPIQVQVNCCNTSFNTSAAYVSCTFPKWTKLFSDWKRSPIFGIGLYRLHQYVYGQPVSNSKNAKVGVTFLISFLWYTIQMYTGS